jgi:hypothetical protein
MLADPIPLLSGFSLGLGTWATVVALGFPMRWLKELTNSAT